MKKLCARCHETHLRKDCQEEKKTRFDYIRKFMGENEEIDSEFYGGLYERMMVKTFLGGISWDLILKLTFEKSLQTNSWDFN